MNQFWEGRSEWLRERGVSEDEVFMDELTGREYIVVDDGFGGTEREYLESTDEFFDDYDVNKE